MFLIGFPTQLFKIKNSTWRFLDLINREAVSAIQPNLCQNYIQFSNSVQRLYISDPVKTIKIMIWCHLKHHMHAVHENTIGYM